jgi:hypothetical protein
MDACLGGLTNQREEVKGDKVFFIGISVQRQYGAIRPSRKEYKGSSSRKSYLRMPLYR